MLDRRGLEITQKLLVRFDQIYVELPENHQMSNNKLVHSEKISGLTHIDKMSSNS